MTPEDRSEPSARFCVLASGSRGNAAVIHTATGGLLVDFGLGPRELGDRLAAVGLRWADLSAAVLTHTHTDHWNRYTLGHLQRYRIPLHLHPLHAEHLSEVAAEFAGLTKAGLIRTYSHEYPFETTGLTVTPIRVPHDSDPTFAFRIDGHDPRTQLWWSLGYASDLGEAPQLLADALQTVDVLAIEFNHDVEMQRTSRRPARLIARVLGRQGHLSNEQAVDFCRHRLSNSVRLTTVVQLHLSQECNTPDLARRAFAALDRPGLTLITARQDQAAPAIELTGSRTKQEPITTSSQIKHSYQPRLPGM